MISLKQNGKLNLKEICPPIVLLLIFVLLILWPGMDSNMTILGNKILPFVILSLSWSIFSGPTKYMSLATAAFYGIGIYTTAIFAPQLISFIEKSLPFLQGWGTQVILMLVAGVVSFALAVFVGAITLRLRGVYFTIFTFGLLELMRNLINWIEMRTGGSVGRRVPSLPALTVYFCMIGLVFVLLVTAWLIKRSRFGKALVSIGESEDAAAHIGVNTTVVKVGMFAVSSFFMGAVGAAMASTMYYTDPPIAFNMKYSFVPVLMVIFGGTRNLAGPIIGAVVFTYLEVWLLTHPIFSPYYMILIGLVMIIAILFLPGGIVGLGHDVHSRLRSSAKNALQGSKQMGGVGDADA